METKQFLNLQTHALHGRKLVEGNKFGIELELEGRGVAMNDIATRGWARHQDGSLRGESIEYITNGAKTLDECTKLVKELFKKFDENGVKFTQSVRTSTHVHLNFSDKTVKQAINFFALFTLLEEVLQYYSGEDRKGNLFCISTRDADGIVGVVAQAIAKGDLSAFGGDRYKYAACNLSTLYKFGTIEVRTMRGASSADQVNKWLSILNDLYTYSLAMASPASLVTDLSILGAERLMKTIFSEANFKELIKYFPVIQTLHYSLMEGARLIQVFSYEFDDAFTAKIDPKMKEKMGNVLPVVIQEGPMAGINYQIWKPDGNPWNMIPVGGGHVWNDGDECNDDARLYWNGALARFVYRFGPGDEVMCNWVRHHNIPDEGPPAVRNRRELPRRARPGWLRDVEPEDDDDDEIHFDDDFDINDDDED